MQFCAIIIPSRGRPVQCKRAIESVINSSGHTEQFRFFVRLDEDDATKDDYLGMPFTTIVVGPRKMGWASNADFCQEIIECDAKYFEWVWILNDDMVVIGDSWNTKLRAIPTTGFIVQTEIHQLNESWYPLDDRGPAPIVPNGCWKPYRATLPSPYDTGIRDLMIRHGWKVRFLLGLTLFHDRANETTP